MPSVRSAVWPLLAGLVLPACTPAPSGQDPAVDASVTTPDAAPADGGEPAPDGGADAPTCAPATPLFLNRRPGRYVSGPTDAAIDQAPFIPTQADVAPTTYDDPQWRALVGCVRAAVAPLDVVVVETEPAGGRYTEVAVSDRYWEPVTGSMGFVASDACQPPDRPIAFVFTGTTSGNLRPLDACQDAVAVWAMVSAGLDFVASPAGRLDYLGGDLGGNLTPTWIDEPLPCGRPGLPGPCRCTGEATQNAIASLRTRYGAACP